MLPEIRKARNRSNLVLFAILILGISTHRAAGLGFEDFGPAGEHLGISPDWPKGAVPIKKHSARVYWREVNGDDHSYYDGDVAEINELLQLFSELEQDNHEVVLRAGRPSAMSFGGKATPYAVEFHLPGGIYLFHARRNAKSGLYSTEPRLFIYISEALRDKLDELKVPPNVEIHRRAFDQELLLASARNGDGRALRLLGEDGYDSEEARVIIDESLKSDKPHVKAAAESAKKALDAASDDTELRKLVSQFITSHPQRYRVPDPAQVLGAIKAVDAKYANEGFTANGTLVNDSGTLMNWMVTMGKQKLLIRQTADKDEATGVIDHTIFASPEHMGSIQQSQYWVDGKLIQSKPFMSREPVGNTYDLLIGRLLWPLGISFSRRIDRVEKVSIRPDGTLDVLAYGENNLGIRWELRVDPKADYLITQAKGFRTRKPEELEYIVDAAGVVKMQERFANHTARWREGIDAKPISISVHSVSAKPDIDLIFEFEDKFIEGKPDDE